MKKISRIFLVVMIMVFLSSCDQVTGLVELAPKFNTSLPNAISGEYAYFETEEDRENGEFTRLLSFSSSTSTFKDTRSLQGGIVTRNGSYSVSYSTYDITECNGTILMEYEDGEKSEVGFYFYATAINGPEYLVLSDGRTYWYWGK